MFNLFKKKKEENTRGDHYMSLKVREVVNETPDTVTIYFEQPDPYLEYKPGQFLTVILSLEGKEQRRSYSLCTSPFTDPHPAITVKRVKKGRVSNYLNDQMRPGKTIEIMTPMGNFTTEFHSKNKRHFVLVAGGSGITPIMGIMKSVLINEPDSKITLIYCSRSEGQIIFNKQLQELQTKNSDRLEVIHNLSQPTSSWAGLKGRLTVDVIKNTISNSPFKATTESIYFLCGPDGIMETAEKAFEELAINKDAIHKESFYLNLDVKEEALKSNGKLSPELTREVEVQVEGQSYSFEVAAGKTILEAGLDNDINMPYSCQSGLCTACRGKLISGKVDMIEDAGLSANEIAAGFILCCSSKPASGDIKIVIE